MLGNNLPIKDDPQGFTIAELEAFLEKSSFKKIERHIAALYADKIRKITEIIRPGCYRTFGREPSRQ